jgi:hypothetical protein
MLKDTHTYFQAYFAEYFPVRNLSCFSLMVMTIYKINVLSVTQYIRNEDGCLLGCSAV